MIIKSANMKEFSEYCNNKTVACYGIGNDFQNIVKSNKDFSWLSSVRYLVDNSSDKWGKQEVVNGKIIPIMSLDEFLNINPKNTIIFITCQAYAEIISELNDIAKLEETECFVFDLMFSLPMYDELKIRQTLNANIPPKIHYCWFGGGQLPDLYKRCIESWSKYCPDYEIVRWDEANCDIEENRYAKQAYDCGKYGFVPDYFRLKIIYENGGIYLDTDVELIKNLDDLRYNEAFCGLQYPWMAALGLGFGACRGNPVIKKMMNRYEKISFINSDGIMNETVSTIYQTMDLEEMGMEYKKGIQVVNGMTIYPIEVLSPKNLRTGDIELSKFSYSVHHYDGSWVSDKQKHYNNERYKNAEIVKQLLV